MSFLRLIRWPNLLLVALTLCMVHYGFFRALDLPVALGDVRFALLVLATVLIAAGGYIINDILDQGTDAINKPDAVIIGKSISEKTAYNLYGALTITGVALGYYLSDHIGRSSLVGIFILSAWVLYLYASNFKQTLIVGNVLVSLLTAIVVLLPGVYDLLPMLNPENRAVLTTTFEICLDYAAFAFVVSLMREITKDLEDIEGDSRMGMNTLPIAFGNAIAQTVALALGVLALLGLLYYAYFHFVAANLWYAAAFLVFGAVAPLVFYVIRIKAAQGPKEYHFLGNLLKLVLLAGVLTLGVVTLNMRLNAAG